MEKIKFIFIFLTIFLFYVSSVNAETKLVCLEKGETIKFSLCNDYMEDRTCNSEWKCNYCVNEIRKGVYCPTQINYCNQLGLACQSIKNVSDINQTNNQTPPTNNNSNTENNKSNVKTVSVTSFAITENPTDLEENIKNQNSNITLTSSNEIKSENKENQFIFLKLFLFLFLLEFLALGFLLYTTKKKKMI